VIVLPEPSYANAISDAFLNNNQKGSKALQQAQYSEAASLFNDADWQAYSYYRNGEFDKAAKLFSGKDAKSWYNKGNALAQLGQYKEAITAYEKALAIQPQYDDAIFNKALVKK